MWVAVQWTPFAEANPTTRGMEYGEIIFGWCAQRDVRMHLAVEHHADMAFEDEVGAVRGILHHRAELAHRAGIILFADACARFLQGSGGSVTRAILRWRS